MIIKIDALDTLFFRDGKPFTMGEDTWANGVFPPSPSVIYGALRSAYFSHHLNELKKANNEDDPTRDLKIKGFYILADNNAYLPLPNDCVREKSSKDDSVSVLTMQELKNIKSSCPTQHALKSEKEEVVVENVDGGLISIDSFKEYLKCAKDSFSYILKVADRVLPEPKIGIGINRESGTSEEGKLYRVDMRRLENKRGEYLFSWDNVPGNDNKKLQNFLKDDLDIDWTENAEIKSKGDMAISIAHGANSAEIIMDVEKKKAILEIPDGRTTHLRVIKQDGKLNIYRGESFSLIVDFEGLDLPKRGMMKLGGEGKAVSYEQIEPVDFSIDNFNLNGNKFKVYLSTPAIFENGWLPAWLDQEQTLIGEYKGLKLKLLTASIGKPVHIGGFDMKERKPKPMRKAVPAGSVYYFEILKGDMQKAFEIFNQSAISEFYQEQGFGIAYVGGAKNV